MADFTLTIGADTVPGTAGADKISATASTLEPGDSLNGGGGIDTLRISGGGAVDLTVLAAFTSIEAIVLDDSGTELQLRGTAPVTVTGGLGDDAITGGNAAETINGGGGNDTLDGGTGADKLAGGAGNDTYVVGAGDTVAEAAGAGTDTVQASIAYTLGANLENLTLTGGSNVNGTGNIADNILTGNDNANKLSGLAGADTLIGGGGNDTPDGGLGSDSLAGGLGDDVYVLDSAADVVKENPGEGTDTVQATFSIDLTLSPFWPTGCQRAQPSTGCAVLFH